MRLGKNYQMITTFWKSSTEGALIWGKPGSRKAPFAVALRSLSNNTWFVSGTSLLFFPNKDRMARYKAVGFAPAASFSSRTLGSLGSLVNPTSNSSQGQEPPGIHHMIFLLKEVSGKHVERPGSREPRKCQLTRARAAVSPRHGVIWGVESQMRMNTTCWFV